MRTSGDIMRLGGILAMIFGASMIFGGCAPTINYLYDPVAEFSTLKSYRWSTEASVSRQDLLVERNVRYYADRSLKDKGFALTSDKPDFVISMTYEIDYYRPYEVRVLNLYVYGMQKEEPIWQGTAAGGIKSDAASSDLAKAIKKVLMNFPPKR